MLTMEVPESGWARCPRCDQRLGRVRYFRDDIEVDWDYSDGEGYLTGLGRVLHSRAGPAKGYGRVLALPVGWERDSEARWTIRPNRARRLAEGRSAVRSRLPYSPGEPGVTDLRNAGWTVSVHDTVICSGCHAPLGLRGSAYVDRDYLIDLG